MTRTSNRTSASVLALLASVGLCLGVACASKPIVANSPIDHEEKIVQRALDACTNAQKQRERVSLLMSQGRLQRALRIIDKADALCPDSEKESSGMKLLALAELGRRADAEKLISQMLTNGTSEAQQAVASAKELLRKSLPTVTKDLPAEGTIERRAIEEARRQARDLIVQGRGLVEKGEYVKAKENFLAAWGLRHPFGAVLLEAGLAAKQAGESAESQRLFDRAIEELEAQTGEKMKFELPNKVLGFSGSSLVFSHDSQTFSFLKGHEISIRSTVTLREKIKLVDQDEIGAISISPDGKTLLSSSWGKLRFWDAGTGDLVRTIKTGNLFHVAPAFSPDGSEIGYFDNSSGVVRITNLKDGREVSTKTSFVSDLQFSPDGTLLAVNLFHSTAIMEAKTGKIRYSITHPIGRKQSPFSVVFRFVDGGKSILSFWRDHLWAVYDAETGALVKQKKLFRSGPEYCLDQADLSPNLATMAMITCDNTFVYYDLVREKEILRETKVSHPVRVLYAPDGNNLLVQTDNGFSKLDVSTLRWQHSFFSHSDPSIAAEMNEKESTLLTSSKYGVNGLWDINGEAFRWFRTKAKNLDSATFHSDGVSVLTSGLDMSFAGQHLIECWDANSAKPCRDPVIVAYGIPLLGRDTSLSGYGNELVWFDTLTGKEKRKEKLVGGNAESPEGPLVLGGSQESGLYLVADMNGTVWEISANDELPTAVIRTPTGSFDGILSLTASRAGILRAFAENNGNVVISSLAGSTKCQTSRSVRAMKFSDDESMLACGSTVLQICDTARGEILRQFDEQNGSITSVKFSPDGKWLISGSDDGTTRLWNLRYGEKMPLPRRHRESVDSIGVSSNGDVIVTSAKDSVLIWDKPSGQLIRKEYPHSVLDSTVFALDPSGQKIALRFDTNLALVDTHDNTVHSVIPNVSLRVRALRFSHRGKVLAAVSDKNLTLWDTQTGKVIWEIPYIAGPKDRLAFSADDTKIHIGSDASLTTWDVTGGLRLSSVALPTTFRGVLSDDFRRFASIGAKGEILISDTSTGSNLQTITGVNYYLDSLALSEDGSYLLAAVGPEIWLWDLTSGDVLRKFKREHGASVSTLHLAQRLGVFVIGYQDGSVEARDLVTGEMLPNWPAAKRPEMRELVKRDATMIPKDLKQSVTLVTHSHYPAGYILYGGGFIEMRAADADSLRQLKELPICRFGSLSFPFELCEERFRVPTGTLANWMKGDFGAFEPLPPATNLVYPLSTHSYRWRMNDNMTSAPRTVSSVKDIHRIPDDERWVGPFWLRKQLGEGGFAPVWLAEERYGDFKLRDVAIKLFLVPSSADQTVRRERILEEARTLCLVQHPKDTFRNNLSIFLGEMV